MQQLKHYSRKAILTLCMTWILLMAEFMSVGAEKKAFQGVPATNLANVYECYVEVSEEIAVTMYLRIDEEGNFVFSRSTDFSDTAKGAGQVYRRSQEATLPSGVFDVDISWSPMEGTIDPIIEVDGSAMAFKLYSAENPAEEKGNGSIAYADGVYALNFADGSVTTFTYEAGVMTFTSKLWYGTASFNKVDEAGQFESYTAVLKEETVSASEKEVSADSSDGVYAVDISWSPMAEMFKPMLAINGSDMTFSLYGADTPSETKGNGTVSVENGVYTLHFENGETTTFTLENNQITFTSKLWYGTASFNQEGKDGRFIPYTAVKTNASDAPYCLVYYVKDGVSVEAGEYVSDFEVTETGSIQFLSPMWFGATEPKFAEEDGSVIYPEFIVSAEKIVADLKAESIVAKNEETEEEKEKESEEQEGAFKTGTYGGNHTTTAMGTTLVYGCSLTFQEDGTYSYTVTFNMMGSSYRESESGTYTVNGSLLTLTSSDGTVMSGSVGGNTVSITRKVSSFAFSPATITLTYGGSSAAGSDNFKDDKNQKETEKETNKETEKETEKDTNKETEDGTENQPETEPESNGKPDSGKKNLTSGEYAVDISWSPMGKMFSPVLKIDAENMTFQVYNGGAPESLKGKGSITLKDGVYTLNYENGNTTTFTLDDQTINFTSKLWFGAASFNNLDQNENFVSYKATQKGGTSSTPETESESETESETSSESESESESETENNGVKTGLYSGSYSTSAMNNTVTYQYTLNLNENGSYVYAVSFTMMGESMNQSENGTYEVTGTTLTLTAENGTVMNGTITADGSLKVTRRVSSFAFSDVEIAFVYGMSGLEPTNVIKADKKAKADVKPKETENTEAEEAQTETESETSEAPAEKESETTADVTSTEKESETTTVDVPQTEKESEITEASAAPTEKKSETTAAKVPQTEKESETSAANVVQLA